MTDKLNFSCAEKTPRFYAWLHYSRFNYFHRNLLFFAPFDPIKSDAKTIVSQWPYLMGTDATGMDVFSRVLYAPRVDLAIALLGTLLSAILGVILGAIAGFYDSSGKAAGVSLHYEKCRCCSGISRICFCHRCGGSTGTEHSEFGYGNSLR